MYGIDIDQVSNFREYSNCNSSRFPLSVKFIINLPPTKNLFHEESLLSTDLLNIKASISSSYRFFKNFPCFLDATPFDTQALTECGLVTGVSLYRPESFFRGIVEIKKKDNEPSLYKSWERDKRVSGIAESQAKIMKSLLAFLINKFILFGKLWRKVSTDNL